MISVDEAKALVRDHTPTPQSGILPLHQAVNRILAADLYAPHPSPAFNQAAMDGWAFAFDDLQHGPLPVVGEWPAGQQAGKLEPQTAVRIFTGAQIPDGADTIVMQEHAEVLNQHLHINHISIQKGAHIRPIGSQIKQGDLALPAGQRLNPAAIGFIASLGLDMVRVYLPPRIHIIITGNELVAPGDLLPEGSVYESNSDMLRAALQQWFLYPEKIHLVKDDRKQTLEAIEEAAQKADVIFVTGGVSVGDYDFVHHISQLPQTEIVFHKIKQKPGKPFLFARYHQKWLFGFPGNPASVLTCFYYYVVPFLKHSLGMPEQGETMQLPLAADYQKKPGLTVFLKAKIQDQKVYILPGQESYILKSFASANCLAVLPEWAEHLEAGTPVTVYLI